jgi:hypothetical protein
MVDPTPIPFAPKEVQDPANPFFIHPNENPSMVLDTPVFQDGNYILGQPP